MPLFVLANAGVALTAETLRAAATSPITWGIVAGLVVGKPIGVIAGTWLALKTRLGAVPDTLRWGQLVGGAALSGIGFTVALFVTELALDDAVLVAEAKIGILAGSVLAGRGGLADLPAGRGARRPVRAERAAGAAAAAVAAGGVGARRSRRLSHPPPGSRTQGLPWVRDPVLACERVSYESDHGSGLRYR